ncbi:hypothetical protein CEJ86_28375 [Sinorhizobium meliloti]|uniref:Uncharacterized protein n=1 Tax=Rhizobium meliloti TaxID=382 RepID=A0A2J0YUX0_RHIML|nr:hypothetical protein CEJ86_28375 [Sinorhizobium meliloti]
MAQSICLIEIRSEMGVFLIRELNVEWPSWAIKKRARGAEEEGLALTGRIPVGDVRRPGMKVHANETDWQGWRGNRTVARRILAFSINPVVKFSLGCLCINLAELY